MRVLVTGGLGFVGSAVVNRLCVEHEVVTLSRTDRGRWRLDHPDRVQVRLGDVREVRAEDLRGIDVVVHAASTTHNYHLLDTPFADAETNVTGTIALLEAIRPHRTRLLYLSTFFVYGNAAAMVDEASPTHPRGPYPATRLCGEHLAHTWGSTFGFPVDVARLANVYGPDQAFDDPRKAAMNWMIRRLQLGEAVDLYDGGTFVRDYIFVDDVVTALVAILDQTSGGGTWLVATGESRPFADLVDVVHRLTGRRSAIGTRPTPDLHRAVGVRDFRADSGALRGLGWAPGVSFEDGVARTLARYTQRIQEGTGV